jgi:putative redox protein
MEGTVTWVDGVRFVGTASSGHSVVMDGPESVGGQNAGLRPMELILLGVGGCSSFDVVQILQKARGKVESCIAELSAQRADAVPAVFESVHLHFKVRGEGLRDAQVARAVALSAEKYCSASLMLAAGGVKITHSHEIVEPGAEEERSP